MPMILLALHGLNIFIACLCIAQLGLVADSVAPSNRIPTSPEQNVRGTAMGLLFWPGVGGIVDALLFASLLLWWYNAATVSVLFYTVHLY
jgi:TM2 domain-containing membrane protein YozV